MRKFSSYGPVDRDIHYHAPRRELIESAYMQLVGENPGKGGHYITVWAPRQTGKTWIMQQAVRKIRERGDFEVAIISMQSARKIGSDEGVLEFFVRRLGEWFERDLPRVRTWDMLSRVFGKQHFAKPLILITDEFDALREEFHKQLRQRVQGHACQPAERVGETVRRENLHAARPRPDRCEKRSRY